MLNIMHVPYAKHKCVPCRPYLVFFDAFCANALAAAVLDFALVRPSLRTLDAAEAARFDVCLLFFIAQSSFFHHSIRKIMLDKTSTPRQNIFGVYSLMGVLGLAFARPFLLAHLLYIKCQQM